MACRIALQVIRVIHVICEICGLKPPRIIQPLLALITLSGMIINLNLIDCVCNSDMLKKMQL